MLAPVLPSRRDSSQGRDSAAFTKRKRIQPGFMLSTGKGTPLTVLTSPKNEFLCAP